MTFWGYVRRVFMALAFCAGVGVLAQALFFALVLSMDDTLSPSQVIVVFGGSEPRKAAGYFLAHQGVASKIVISPASDKQLSRYDHKFGLPPGVTHLDEPSARTTLENAWYTSRIIKDHRFKTVTLVTADYHMPRSLALMKLFLLGQGVDIHTYKTHPAKKERAAVNHRQVMVKLIYNEMIEFWGSLAEFLVRRISGDDFGKLDEPVWGLSALRSVLLFDVKAFW